MDYYASCNEIKVKLPNCNLNTFCNSIDNNCHSIESFKISCNRGIQCPGKLICNIKTFECVECLQSISSTSWILDYFNLNNNNEEKNQTIEIPSIWNNKLIPPIRCMNNGKFQPPIYLWDTVISNPKHLLILLIILSIFLIKIIEIILNKII